MVFVVESPQHTPGEAGYEYGQQQRTSSVAFRQARWKDLQRRKRGRGGPDAEPKGNVMHVKEQDLKAAFKFFACRSEGSGHERETDAHGSGELSVVAGMESLAAGEVGIIEGDRVIMMDGQAQLVKEAVMDDDNRDGGDSETARGEKDPEEAEAQHNEVDRSTS